MDLFLPVMFLLLYSGIGVFLGRLLCNKDDYSELVIVAAFWPIVMASILVTFLSVAIEVGFDELFKKKR